MLSTESNSIMFKPLLSRLIILHCTMLLELYAVTGASKLYSNAQYPLAVLVASHFTTH